MYKIYDQERDTTRRPRVLGMQSGVTEWFISV